MYRDRNKQILTEINEINFLKKGLLVGENKRKTTKMFSLGSFYSETIKKKIYLGLKEYFPLNQDFLFLQIKDELGLIDFVEKNIPSFVEEFPLFHGLYLDNFGKPLGVITQDYSEEGNVPVQSFNEYEHKKILPYELKRLVGGTLSLEGLATTCFLVNGKRKIGDFGDFFLMDVFDLANLGEFYGNKLENYSIQVPLAIIN